jgi:hypothetical protein
MTDIRKTKGAMDSAVKGGYLERNDRENPGAIAEAGGVALSDFLFDMQSTDRLAQG